MEAFAAPLECASTKIETAKQAIAARLHTSPVPHRFETQAIEEALNALGALATAAANIAESPALV